jgi:hypothetical protein
VRGDRAEPASAADIACCVCRMLGNSLLAGKDARRQLRYLRDAL